jgi:DNA-directed RNA polymerase subunit RPC12/RpoP
VKYPDHKWVIAQRIPLRNGTKEGFIWKCIRCGAELSKTETGHPLLNEVIEEGVSLNCDMQTVAEVMES